MTPDVYQASEELEAAGVKFQKRPNEGRMKGLAFALDPDGYWIEIVSRSAQSSVHNKFTLAQTMLRVKDAQKSLHFYRDLLGMTLLRTAHIGVGEDWAFSLYFLACIPAEEKAKLPADWDPTSPEAAEYIRQMFWPGIGRNLFLCVTYALSFRFRCQFFILNAGFILCRELCPFQ